MKGKNTKILKRLVFLFLAVIIFIPVNTFPLRITNANLAKFDSLLEYLSNHNVVKLDLSYTNITNNQLEEILNQIGGNLRKLELEYCDNLYNSEAIRNCIQLQELSLGGRNTNDKQLMDILKQIGRNLRILKLSDCRNLYNFEAIKNCIHLQLLILSFTNINDKQLTDILNQIGRNLRTLDFDCCKNLHNFEEIKNWARERNIKLYLGR